jgi:hypothetical protein
MLLSLLNNNYKYRCLQAYCLYLFEVNDTAEDKYFVREVGSDTEFQKEECDKIKKIIRDNNNTYETMETLSTYNSKIITFYNSLSDVVEKYFADRNSTYVPVMLAVSCLNEFNILYHGFKDIRFNDVLTSLEKDMTREEIKIHYKCAIEMVETLRKAK